MSRSRPPNRNVVAHRRRQSQAMVAAFTSGMRMSIGGDDAGLDSDEEDREFRTAGTSSLRGEEQDDPAADATTTPAAAATPTQSESTSPSRTSAMGVDSAQASVFTKGLLKTSLQLIDEKAQNLNMVENMLLPLLDQLISNGGNKQNAQYQEQLLEAHAWALGQFAKGAVSLPGSSRYDVRLCGWLGKLGRSGTKVQRRWVELSGQTLSYFADGHGLELRGCLDLDGCLCRPLPPTNRGGFSFELAAESGKVIKKVHSRTDGKYKQKKSYRFWSATEEELTMWLVAIQEAIDQPELRRVKETCARFAEIDGTQPEKYVEALFALADEGTGSSASAEGAAGRGPLLFPCDWLHQQVMLKGSDSMDGPVQDNRHEAKNLEQVYKDFVRDTVVIDETRFECEDGDVIIEELFTKIYEKYAEFHGLDGEGGVTALGTKKERLRHKFMDHYIMRNTLAYARAVLMASCRTVSGGDTYDAVDFMLRNNDIAVICPDSEYVAPVKIMVYYGEGGGEDGGDEGQDERQQKKKREQPSKGVQKKNNNTKGEATEKVVEHDGEESTNKAVAPAPAPPKSRGSLFQKLPSFMSPRSRSSSTGNVNTQTPTLGSVGSSPSLAQEASISKLVKVDSSRQSKMHALRSRFGGSQQSLKSMKSMNGLSAGKSGLRGSTAPPSSSAGRRDHREELEEELASMRWPHVRVHVESRYKVMDADPMGDDPTLARLHTTFSRTFSWGRHTYCKPGEVSVKVMGRARQRAQEFEMRSTGLMSIASIPETSDGELGSRVSTTL